MENSKNYKKVKNYYEKGLWSKTMVLNIVGKNQGITEKEYKEITGYIFPMTNKK